jgi:hypothetical protein
MDVSTHNLMFQQMFVKVCFVFFLAVFAIGCQATNRLTPTAEYIRRPIHGWTVYIHPDALANKDLEPALALLGGILKEITVKLPKGKIVKLQAFPFWIDAENNPTGPITTHFSKEWLNEHGHNPDKAMAVDILHPAKFRWAAEDDSTIVLSALVAAYQVEYLRGNSALLAAYDSAAASHRYKSVRNYFVELSNAYWWTNRIYPFTRSDLREFDPVGFALMERVWLGEE